MSEIDIRWLDPAGASPMILMPLPDRDFDLTEASIPWKECMSRRWKVAISTERGIAAQADLSKLKGPLPGLLSASKKARQAYLEMTQDLDYQHPIPYAEIDPQRYQALLLPGGDGPGMRQYLESPALQGKVLEFWQQGILIGAICHGVLVLARTVNPQTGHSVLHGRKVTAPPGWLDKMAYRLDRLLLRRGYIMYSQCVADEVRLCLRNPEDFTEGPGTFTPYVVSDGSLITARWYLDAELFAQRFADALVQRVSAGS